MSGDRAWAAALRAACEHPEAVARAWRAGGGRVVGLLGWSAPRELVTAAGMLPVRLSPERLAGFPGRGSGGVPGPNGTGGPAGAGEPGRVSGPAWPNAAPTAPGRDRGSSAANNASFEPQSPAGPAALSRDLEQSPDAAAFGRELAPATAALAAALLSGEFGWIDFLLIGRDREDYTRLFYLLRELRRSGAAPDLIPVAFFDLLRLPSRTSARYNRQRTAELTAVIARWAGRPVTPSDLAAAVEGEGVIAHSFRDIQALRTRPQPAITGTDALAAAVAARILPATQLRPLLHAALAASAPGAGLSHTAPGARGGPGMSRASAHDIPGISPYGSAGRVFLAGSGVDDLTAYETLEGLGLAVVGEDHEWGDDGSEYPRATRDPLDGIVDRYHFAHGGAARAGLRDRVVSTADRVRAAGADGVLYLLGPRDEAAGWELPALRDRLGAGIPLVPVRLRDPAQRDPGQRDPAQRDPGQRDPARDGDGGWPELREAGRRLLAVMAAAGPARGAGHAGTASGTAEAGHG